MAQTSTENRNAPEVRAESRGASKIIWLLIAALVFFLIVVFYLTSSIFSPEGTRGGSAQESSQTVEPSAR